MLHFGILQLGKTGIESHSQELHECNAQMENKLAYADLIGRLLNVLADDYSDEDTNMQDEVTEPVRSASDIADQQASQQTPFLEGTSQLPSEADLDTIMSIQLSLQAAAGSHSKQQSGTAAGTAPERPVHQVQDELSPRSGTSDEDEADDFTALDRHGNESDTNHVEQARAFFYKVCTLFLCSCVQSCQHLTD